MDCTSVHVLYVDFYLIIFVHCTCTGPSCVSLSLPMLPMSLKHIQLLNYKFYLLLIHGNIEQDPEYIIWWDWSALANIPYRMFFIRYKQEDAPELFSVGIYNNIV